MRGWFLSFISLWEYSLRKMKVWIYTLCTKKTKPENLFSMNMLNMTYRTGHNREFILLDPFAYFSDEKV